MMNSFKQMRGCTLLKISSLLSAKKKKQDVGMFPNTILGKARNASCANVWFFFGIIRKPFGFPQRPNLPRPVFACFSPANNKLFTLLSNIFYNT